MARVITNEDWKALAERASKEHDREKVLRIVNELCILLDRQDDEKAPTGSTKRRAEEKFNKGSAGGI